MNEEDYFAGVDWLERIDPENALLRRLRSSYTKINTIYLTRLLKEKGSKPVKKTVYPPAPDKLDPDYVDLVGRVGRLFGRRRSLSNSFHNAKDKIERANISDDIRYIQQEISQALKRRRHFDKYGTLPEEVENEEEDLEGLAGIELQRRYNANSKRRNYARKQIKIWAASEAPDADRQLVKWELKYKTEQDEFERLSKALREAAV